MTNLNERLDKQLRSIKEVEDVKWAEVEKAVNKAFDDGEAANYKSGRKKALALLKAVFDADGEKFEPAKVKLNIQSVIPDAKEYEKETGTFDGGDDEDYFLCHFDYDGDNDLLEIGKKYLTPAAYKFLKQKIDEVTSKAWDNLQKYYKQGW